MSLADASPSERAAEPSALAAADVPATPRARPTWIAPLVIGLGIGAAVAAAVFVATSDKEQAASAASARPVPAPSRPEPAATAAVNEPAQPQTAAAPAPPANAADAPALAAPGMRGDVAAPQTAATGALAEARTATPPRASRSDSAHAASTANAPPSSAPVPLAFGDDPLADPQAPGDVAPAPDKTAEPNANADANADANAKTGSSMDALLDEALSPAARRNELARQQEAALAAQQLPLTPSREDVTQAMTVLLPAIRGCAMGQSGLATAAIVVRNDGRVAGVEVSGAPFAGTPSGRCMEGVIRRARFARFQQPIMRIKFPLAIQ